MRATRASLWAFALLLWPGLSLAQGDSLTDSIGARALGSGEAMRALPIGGNATTLNPAGAGLVRAYVLEGQYGFRKGDGGTIAGGSVCDSTTSRVAACLYYNYLEADPSGGTRELHDIGLTLALPLAERVIVGSTIRYVDYSEAGSAANPMDNSRDGEWVTDFGAIVRLSSMVNVGLVGYNIVGNDADNFPRALGSGLSLQPTPSLTFGVDGLWNLEAPEGTSTGRYGVGGEYFFTAAGGEQGYPIRLGYIYDVKNEGSYLTAGLGFTTPRVALDAGMRAQVDGVGDELVVEFGLRLFMPQGQ
jgi:hypothetical protein